MEIWRKMTNNIKKKYKIIIDFTNPTFWYVEILEGFWKGVIYCYGKLDIKEPDENTGSLKFKFERNILIVPDNLKNVQMADEAKLDFDQLLGDILVDIINTNINRIKYKDNILFIDFDLSKEQQEAKEIYNKINNWKQEKDYDIGENGENYTEESDSE